MQETKKQGNPPSDHLANERTFLAWIRTSVGIMAFGFVVVKFSLFVKQISLILGKGNMIQNRGYSAIVGIILVATLQRNSERRKVVLECIKQYNKQLNDQKLQSYITRRRLFLKGIESGEIKTKFDYVIVDEFQDCTNADFKIFIKLLKDSNNFILAGDLAQSVHIGNSSRIYRDISMSKREFHRLKGSYRLPVRISECIEEIPKSIAKKRKNEEGVNEITPYKGSPPESKSTSVRRKKP